jgi:adenylate cyclase
LIEADVATYLEQRFTNGKEKIASAVFARSEGNPLFMVNVVDYLIEQGSLVDAEKIEAPRTIRQMIERNLQRLSSDELRILEAASVAGIDFSAATVAAALERSLRDIDSICTQLARKQQFIDASTASSWPDGTVTPCFRFHHALYQETLYGRTPASHRVELHRLVAAREEAAFGERSSEIAAELAHHYECAHNAKKAVHFLYLATVQAVDRAAYTVASKLVEAALRLLAELPEDEELRRAELALRGIESVVAFVLHGAPSPERERAIIRFCDIAEGLGEQAQLLRGMVSLCSLHWVRGEAALGLEVAKRCLKLRDLAPDPGLLADVYWMAAVLSENCGRLREAVAHYESAVEAACDAARAKLPLSPTWGILHTIMSASESCATLQLLGRVDQAAKTADEALSRARSSQHVFTLCHTLTIAGLWLSSVRHEPEKMSAYGEEVIALSEENGFLEWPSYGAFHRGWALAELGELEKGVTAMEKGVEGFKRQGGIPRLPFHLALLAHGYALLGEADRALTMLEQILTDAEQSGAALDKAEILRISGEVLLMGGEATEDEAERRFRAAIEVARTQEAKWWELRATASLARLLAKQGNRDEARTMLADIYNWFTEGFDTRDLKQAKTLLDELSVAAG